MKNETVELENKILEGVKAAYPFYDVKFEDVVKTNKTKRAIVIRDPEKAVSPAIYLEQFNAEDLSVEKIVEQIAMAYEKNRQITFNTNSYTNWDTVKDTLVPRLINRDKNEEMLKNVPHKDFLDLAVIFTALVTVNGQKGSITVKNEHLQGWDKTIDDIEAAAMKNAPKLLPIGNEDLMEFLNQMVFGVPAPAVEDMPPITIVTNQDKHYGAATILYDGVLEGLARMYNGNYYILPSSVHEVFALPDDGQDPVKLSAMVAEINQTQVLPEEVLADHAYFYDASVKELRVA